MYRNTVKSNPNKIHKTAVLEADMKYPQIEILPKNGSLFFAAKYSAGSWIGDKGEWQRLSRRFLRGFSSKMKFGEKGQRVDETFSQ